MKHRCVFSAPDLRTIRSAIDVARSHGISEEDLSLIARPDIQMDSIPADLVDATTDTLPAALRGAISGGSLGLLAGLIALANPAFGVTIAGAALFAGIGTVAGGWSSALVGSALPNATRRRFEGEIESGRILLVADVEKDRLPAVESAIGQTGAQLLPFDQLSVIS